MAKLPTNMSGIEYLHAVVNDKEADVMRRDRAAGILASIEARRGIAPGKKQQAALEAQWSGYGTDWWDILHRDGEVPSSSPPLSLEPEIRAKALAEQQRQQRQPKAPQSACGTPPSWDELLGPRLPREIPRSEDDEWDADLDPARTR